MHNQTSNLNLADFLAEELARGSRNIIIPKGVYRLPDPGRKFFRMENLKDVVIDFSGSDLIGLGRRGFFDLENCSGVTVQNAVLDYDPLPYTQAEIVEADADGNWLVRVIDGYPVEKLNRGELSFWPVQVYSKETFELINPMRYRDNITVELVDSHHYRITGGIDRRGAVGDIVVFSLNTTHPVVRDFFDDECTVELRHCSFCRIENITVYSTPGGVAFREFWCRQTTYQSCRVDRRPPEIDIVPRKLPRLRSGNHDAFIIKNASIGPQILDCITRWHCDDCINISGVYNLFTVKENGKYRLLVCEQGVNMEPGCRVQIMHPDGKCPQKAKLLSLEYQGKITDADREYIKTLPLAECTADRFHTVYLAELEENPDIPTGSVLMSDDACGNGFLVRGCTLGFTRGRAVLIKASGRVENNTAEGTGCVPIVVNTEYEWMSGGCAGNVEIIGNHLFSKSWNGVYVGGNAPLAKVFPINAHRNIRIADNIITSRHHGIYIQGCTGLQITGNDITVWDPDTDGLIMLENVSEVSMIGNTIRKGLPDRKENKFA